MLLAKQAPFRIAGIEVRPAERRVDWEGGGETIEPRVMEVLIVLARPPGRIVSRDELIETCWGGRAISDDAIQRAIAKLRALAERTDGRDFRIETIAKVGYRMVAAASPEPASATSETEPGPADAATAPPAPERRSRLAWAAAGLALAAASGIGLVPHLRPPDAPAGGEALIEVRTFAASADSELGAFAPSIARATAAAVSAADLVTIGPADAGGAPASGLYRLEGELMRDGASAEVRLRLVDSRDGQVLWSRSERRAASEARYLADQAAFRTAFALRCAFVTRRPPAVAASDARRLKVLLRACDQGREGQNIIEGLESKRALAELDPQFAAGWAVYAASAFAAAVSQPPETAAELRATAEAALARAAALDPASPDVATARAVAEPLIGAWERRLAHIEAALANDPRAFFALAMRAEVMMELGRMAEGLADYRRAAGLNRKDAVVEIGMIVALSAAGQAAEAAAMRDRIYRTAPDSGVGRRNRFFDALFGRNPAEALAMLDDPTPPPDPPSPRAAHAWRRYVAAVTGGEARARRASADELEALAREDLIPWFRVVGALAQLGEIDRAFAAADRAFANPRVGTRLLFMPSAAPLRRDPRFLSLAERIGLVGVWRRTGRWPDFCASPDLPYRCDAGG